MQFIRIQSDESLVFVRNEDELRTFMRHRIKAEGIDSVRNEYRIHLVDVPADRQTLYDALNGTVVMGTEIGEYYITPRGAVKRDHDADTETARSA